MASTDGQLNKACVAAEGMGTNGDIEVDNESIDEVFCDAIDSVSNGQQAGADKEDLISAIADANEALILFLNDRFPEAIKRVEPWADKSIYHAVAMASLRAVEAALTSDDADIDLAVDVVNAATNLCNERRRKGSIMNNTVAKMLITPNYDLYTEEEVHAELAYAECFIIKTALSVIRNVQLVGLIHAGIRCRIAYQVYKECQIILENRTWSSPDLKGHFESGINLGVGCFNLVLAQLPSRYIKAVEFLGFSGDYNLGFEKLSNGNKRQEYLRAPFCTVAILTFHVGYRYICGKGIDSSEYDQLEKLYQPLLERYPQSSLIRYGGARIQLACGNVTQAISVMETILDEQRTWNKFNQFTLCELAFCYVSLGNYRSALPLVDIVCQKGTWSRATYYYAKAAILCMCEDRSSEETLEMIKLMKELPSVSPNVGDNTLSVENFLNNRARKFNLLNNWLPMPALEMMYLWNTILYLKGKCVLLEPIVAKIDRTLSELTDRLENSPYRLDSYCLLIFMKGLCLQLMGFPLSAEQLFIEVIENEPNIVDDKYVISFALVELGYVYIDAKKYEIALSVLKTARAGNLKQTFVLEGRIHTAIENIKRSGFNIKCEPEEDFDVLQWFP